VAAIDRASPAMRSDVAEAGARLARELGATAEALSMPDSANVAATLIAMADGARRARDRRRLARAGAGSRRRVLGSTSRKLLHDTHRPVLVVRTPE
jgi:nucleotide-binding universal stress UspA family protein